MISQQASQQLPREFDIQCPHPGGMHRMHVYEWGAADNPDVLLCVHGLTRCGRDFDELAKVLSTRYRVICPDIVGRGMSEWLPVRALYSMPQYLADIHVLLASLTYNKLDWVGTSMGGLIGMSYAGSGGVVSKLVLNDVGPVIPSPILYKLGEYLVRAPRLNSYAEAEAFVRKISVGFGQLTDAQWAHLTTHVIARKDDGEFVFRYDPAIGDAYRDVLAIDGGESFNLWPFYDAITCPTLLLRGALSELLPLETAKEMTLRGPRATLIEIPETGHAPALLSFEQIALVDSFLT